MALTGSVLRGVGSARLLLRVSGLHSSAARPSLEVTAEAQPGQGLSEDLDEGRRVKSLREMPGPGAISNLVEFFYRDGFSRIHEIQVRSCVLRGKSKLHQEALLSSVQLEQETPDSPSPESPL